ncbi:alpha-hydroxy acid oxidase [Achromobacter deleyi]|uniref:alpha-hydroxy acid oxidase n=1 Tax=Achromobacter deleyi TaxID=1353891 RepID=UPI001490F647|nr:alpha-hydroxy acid oxidase [Achromobacter deleyi]QVQ25943.1 alpha-hydroxy-acid oxidizing protein [Achromobacter deleyi]UIP21483.1 alpha-hydroxy-acid oxidizing protein [Achromobacter deleyi]
MLPSVMDYRRQAQRRLPRLAYDYLEGGAEDGITLARNTAAYAGLEFRPDVLVDVTDCRLEVPVLGATAAMPAIVGPTGLNGLFWPEADVHLARAAHQAGLPFVLSTASTSLLEHVRAATSGELWLQLYVQRDRRIAEHLMDRAWQNGYTVLFLTVDVPVHGNRDHDKRNGFKLPLRPSPRLLLDLAAHPGWCWRMLRHGGPQLKNLAVSSNARENITEQASALSRQMDLALTWDDVAWLRRVWRGRIVIKGIQGLADARRAQAHGVDGIVLSNHGGRQLESAPCPLDVLPEVAAELGHALEVLVDGGVRRGSDIAKAVALGARAVLLGRAPLYGLAGRGPKGASEVLAILRGELENTLRLLGRNRIGALDAAAVRKR